MSWWRGRRRTSWCWPGRRQGRKRGRGWWAGGWGQGQGAGQVVLGRAGCRRRTDSSCGGAGACRPTQPPRPRRLWQLQNKMAAAGGAAAYDARLERVVGAREAVEGRLASRIGAVDAYARVISMIEIEVEMDAELPDAEVLGAPWGGVAVAVVWAETMASAREAGGSGLRRGAPCWEEETYRSAALTLPGAPFLRRARTRRRHRGADSAAGGGGGAAGGVAAAGGGGQRGREAAPGHLLRESRAEPAALPCAANRETQLGGVCCKILLRLLPQSCLLLPPQDAQGQQCSSVLSRALPGWLQIIPCRCADLRSKKRLLYSAPCVRAHCGCVSTSGSPLCERCVLGWLETPLNPASHRCQQLDARPL